MNLPTGRRGQVYAVAGLAAVLLLLWQGLIAPLAGWYAARSDAIMQKRELAAHLQTLVAQLPVLEARAEHAAGQPRDASGATDARAGADLQQQIEAMAAQAGAHLASVEFLQPEAADGYKRIALRISLTGRYPVLIGLLAAIEQAAPPLFVDDLQLRATGGEGDPAPNAELTFVAITLRAAAPRAPA